MERDLNVNASLAEDDRGDDLTIGLGHSSEGGYGPCLYLGPAGQRCSRPALADGFCAQHQPSAERETSPAVSFKRVVAILAALAALWPLVVDLVREIIRLLR